MSYRPVGFIEDRVVPPAAVSKGREFQEEKTRVESKRCTKIKWLGKKKKKVDEANNQKGKKKLKNKMVI